MKNNLAVWFLISTFYAVYFIATGRTDFQELKILVVMSGFMLWLVLIIEALKILFNIKD